MELLKDKVAVVTGGTRGIGKQICLEFASQGANVVFNYVNNVDAAAEVVSQIEEMGQKALALQGSVDEPAFIKEMFQKVNKEFGQLDILVNNAGITRDGFVIMMDQEKWDNVISTNLNGCFYCCREGAKLMMRKKKGVIVNMSSLTGVMGQPGQANYAASKGGVIGFTKSIAKEFGAYGIRVNALAPGFIKTEMVDAIPDEVAKKNLDLIVQNRFGSVDEVAKVALFLASPMSSYITGEIINVNGGLYM